MKKLNGRALVCGITLMATICLAPAAEAGKSRPNIIWIVSDDHGWTHSEPYGDTWVKTPNMSRLAKEGMRFTNAYAASPLCTPSRAVMGTGLYPYRNGGHVFDGGIKEDVRTLPEYFHDIGYNVVLSGKMHFLPARRYPFDQYSQKVEDGAKYIQGYDWQRPLILLVCSLHPHTPWPKTSRYSPVGMPLSPRMIDTPELRNETARYYEAVTLLDDQIGQVLDELQKAGKEKETLVLYTSDQGPNFPFAKWCMYDQGLRTPMLARWPGHIQPGSVTDAMVSLADMLPTSLDVAGATPPKEMDGRSFLKVLTGETNKHRDAIFGEHSGNLLGGEGIANLCPMRSVRTEDYLYILNLAPNRTFRTHLTGVPPGVPLHMAYWSSWVAKAQTDPAAKATVEAYQHRPQEELYDVKNDLEQSHNLVGDPKHAQALEKMRAMLAEWREQQGDSVQVCLEPEPATFPELVEQWRNQIQLEKDWLRRTPPQPAKPTH